MPKAKKRKISPCRKCPPFTVTVARDAAGRFKAKPKPKRKR